MSWLSSFWKHNRNFIGNALKNVSPAAFLIPGVGPLAAAGLAGAGSALGRGIQEGSNFGDIVRQGLQGAGQAYLGARLTGGQGNSLQRLKNLFTGGSGGSPAAQSARAVAQNAGKVPEISFTPSSAAGGGATAGTAGELPGLSVTPSAITMPAPAAAPLPGAAANALGGAHGASALNQALAFAKANPMAVALGLQGAGQLSQIPLQRAQQRQIDLENQQRQQEIERQRARDEALAPLWKLFEARLRGQYT